ncbi:TDT family transporter [Clostridium saccharobutylicum]|uniref:C4-dicarboxylate transporter/malic acid transport protein n=1 Tax=Clostridium saccharobutylicum TaxID=169679 RepID=A0A1S8MYB5_CLOSA|nr:TDT family transporter [Clostridium saccharobutylicum]OOM09164.1 C4-dicarboxylate transporter/malic acid transport protein [Clostridium saccharobutylicum]
MKKKSLFQRLENLPVPILQTMVGLATLSNIYLTLGYTFIRHITMWIVTIILITYIVKIIFYYDTFKKEYSNTIYASIYSGFTMVTMILGSYYFDFNPLLGKGMWFMGIGIHAIHILVFTYRNVIKGVNKDTFVPSWFVTYNGIMVSTAIGGVMNEPVIGKIIVYYGIGIFVFIIPFMIYRLITTPVKDGIYHTQAILIAPSSLCVVGYLNYIKEPNLILLYGLYTAVILAVIFVFYKIPKFFSYSFTPAFAGLTFPMAIGIVASSKMSAFLTTEGYSAIGGIVKEICGIQIYITTAIFGFIVYNFLKMLVGNSSCEK